MIQTQKSVYHVSSPARYECGAYCCEIVYLMTVAKIAIQMAAYMFEHFHWGNSTIPNFVVVYSYRLYPLHITENHRTMP